MDFIITGFQKYYGIDWLAMALMLASFYALGNRKKVGFVFAIIGSFCWMIVNFEAHIIAGVILNVALVGMNARGYLKWRV